MFWSKIEQISESKHRSDNDGALIQNVIYGPDAINNRCDIFYPENLKGKNPTIIVIHGGAYIGGDIKSTRKLCKEFAKMGLIVFNFEYTKSDRSEQKYFPTPVYEFYDFYKHILKDFFKLLKDKFYEIQEKVSLPSSED